MWQRLRHWLLWAQGSIKLSNRRARLRCAARRRGRWHQAAIHRFIQGLPASGSDVKLVHGAVRECAGARTHHGVAHLVLTLGKCTTGSIGARNTAPLVIGDPRCFANQRFTLIIEGESALASHHVSHLAGEHTGLVGNIIDGIELYVEHR